MEGLKITCFEVLGRESQNLHTLLNLKSITSSPVPSYRSFPFQFKVLYICCINCMKAHWVMIYNCMHQKIKSNYSHHAYANIMSATML